MAIVRKRGCGAWQPDHWGNRGWKNRCRRFHRESAWVTRDLVPWSCANA